VPLDRKNLGGNQRYPAVFSLEEEIIVRNQIEIKTARPNCLSSTQDRKSNIIDK